MRGHPKRYCENPTCRMSIVTVTNAPALSNPQITMTNTQLLFVLGIILFGMRNAAEADKKSLKSLRTFGTVLFVAAVIAFALEHLPAAATS
jgi:hypothetical protein